MFDLIKSLNGSEKRYFNLFLRRHFKGGSVSLTLYETLQRQNTYDEPAAIGATGLGRNHYAVQKTILYKQLLQALIQYNTETDLPQKLQQEIFATKILLQKGLTQQAKVKQNQIRQSAEQYEQHEVMLQALQLGAAIAAREQFRDTDMEDIDMYHQNTASITDQIWLESLWRYTYNAAQKIQLQAGGKSEANAGRVKSLLKKATIQSGKKSLTRKAQMDKMQTEALYHFMHRDAVKAFRINTAFIAMIEADSTLISLYPQRYFSALNNYLIDCFNLSETGSFQQTLSKMRGLKENPAFRKLLNLEINIFRITYQAELNFLIARGEFEQAAELLEPVKNGLKEHKDNIPIHHRINMEYLCAYALFGSGQYSAASSMLDGVQRYRRTDTAAAPDVMAAVMQVLCHYELKNYSIIDSLVKSAKRKLKQHNEMASESTLELLNSVSHFAVKQPQKSDWEKLGVKLDRALDKTETTYSNYFDYRTYVASKAAAISYAKAWRTR